MKHFSFLKKIVEYRRLYGFCSDVEKYIETDPELSLLKARQAIEFIMDHNRSVPKSKNLSLDIAYLADNNLASPHIVSQFHLIRKKANFSIHNKGKYNTKGVLEALIEISIWFVLKSGNKKFSIYKFAEDERKIVKDYILEANTLKGITHNIVDIINPLETASDFSCYDNVNDADVLAQDVFETEEEYQHRIETMEPQVIGKAYFDSKQIDEYCQIAFPIFHFYQDEQNIEESQIVALIIPVIDNIKSFNGVLKAKLRVCNRKLYYNYNSLTLNDDNGKEVKVTVIAWEKFGYENDEDFSKRISILPMIPVCVAQPLRKEYDLKNEVLPFNTKPMAYTLEIFKTTKIDCVLNRFDARDVCSKNVLFNVYANVSANLSLYNFHFFNSETGIHFTSDEIIEGYSLKEKAAIQGDEHLHNKLAEAVAGNGNDIIKDEDKKYTIYKKAMGSSLRPIELANYCANGIDVTKDEEKIFIAYKQKYEKRRPDSSKVKDNGWFLYFTAKRYSIGFDVEKNEEMAFNLYKQAAEIGVSEAQYALAECYYNGAGVEKNEEIAFNLYKQAAERGVSKAQYALAECYYNGIGVVKNEKIAFDWYLKAAAQGLPEAQHKIYNFYSADNSVEKRNERSFKWFKKAVEKGYDKIELINYFFNDFGVDKEKELLYQLYKEEEKAFGLYQSRAWAPKIRFFNSEKKEKYDFEYYQQLSNQWIQYFLAKSYSIGDNYTMKDEDKAFNLYKIAAEKNLVKAQYALAECYYNGIGVEKDEEIAFDWYLKAAAQGLPEAQIRIANCYSNDIVANKDEINAFRLYKEALENGHGIIELANRYSNGNGVEKDEEKAFELYKKIENRWFLYFTAECYSFGEGIDKDEYKAFALYKKAAEKGLAKAQYALAECYYNGTGVEKNEAIAFDWYLKATAQGCLEAKEKITNYYYKGKRNNE